MNDCHVSYDQCWKMVCKSLCDRKNARDIDNTKYLKVSVYKENLIGKFKNEPKKSANLMHLHSLLWEQKTIDSSEA